MKKKQSNTVQEPEVYYSTFSKYESDLSNPLRMLAFANRGIPAATLDGLVSLSMQGREVFAQRLNISLKTIERYHKEGKSFDPVMSELILQWLQMYHKGKEVFGSISSFNRWLVKPAHAFEGMVPESFTHTSGGVRLILDALFQIEHGDFS